MTIRAVFFDVGEVLVDETTEYGTWADWLGVPRHTFSAVFGAVIARGLDYREAFRVFRPGFDLETERRHRAEAGEPETFTDADLYPDARPCLAALRDQGLTVGVAGNQTARAESILRSLDLPIDVLGTSDSWGTTKPSTAFFERVIAEAGVPAEHILYVATASTTTSAPPSNWVSAPRSSAGDRGGTSCAAMQPPPSSAPTSKRPACSSWTASPHSPT
ncbi:HAD family hydrolase [Saccharomonospora sp. CUA-673]|uniref:HAD family hydrolase n=1 Tax=Saccharomonospora sp. CUA-673 TaxID=1904969 RepID=UPI000AA1F1AD|nr:HAD family hydrolase [Saccharomonospora sp. CUA-673]